MTRDPRYRRLTAYLRPFFTDYLKVHRGLSLNTLRSYRDTWRLLFSYGCKERNMQKPEQWRIHQVNRALILDFLVYLEQERQVSAATRNCRLAGLHVFFSYLTKSEPELELHCRRILTIPSKKTSHTVVGFLDSDEMEAVLRAVPQDGPLAKRDLALLVFAYNTGARVSEIAQARLSHIIPGPSPCVRIVGKGNRERIVPLWEGTLRVIQSYVRLHRAPPHDPLEASYLFLGSGGKRLTRFHVGRIITRYFKKASEQCPAMRKKKLTAHSMRHTTAVHLLQGGAEMNTIKTWLGHSSVESTQIYLGLDLRKKRDILDRLITPEFATLIAEKNRGYTGDKRSLIQWLESL